MHLEEVTVVIIYRLYSNSNSMIFIGCIGCQFILESTNMKLDSSSGYEGISMYIITITTTATTATTTSVDISH